MGLDGRLTPLDYSSYERQRPKIVAFGIHCYKVQVSTGPNPVPQDSCMRFGIRAYFVFEVGGMKRSAKAGP